MRAGLPEATIWRVASMPSTFGMRTSISTTSGSCSATRAIASAPSAASPTTSMSSLRVEDHPKAAAHERLVVGDHDLDAHVSGRRAWTR